MNPVTLEEISALYEKYVMETYARADLLFVRGKGCRLYDSAGKEYLDFAAGIAVCSLGHCHPAVTKAIQEQAAKLVHVSNLFLNEWQPRLAQKLISHGFDGTCFFCNSGAEANEALIKLARKNGSEKGRYEILFVPSVIRRQDMATGTREPVLTRYERVCFDKQFRAGKVPATFLCPGHPLMEAVLHCVKERLGPLLRRGAVLVDENDETVEARLLFYIEQSLTDGVTLPDGNKRLVSRRFHFVEISESGKARDAGQAPYLDYRPASANEQDAALKYAAQSSMLGTSAESRAIAHAVTVLIPPHLKEVKERRLALVDKTAKAVQERLTAEIRHWDYQAAELRVREQAGKRNARLNAQQAERRAEELAERMKVRLAELDAERHITVKIPHVVGGCLVIPKGLLTRLLGEEPEPDHCPDAQTRRQIELAAMEAVMKLERKLGYDPRDVSTEKCGYDIESMASSEKDGVAMRFIEVKGRAKGSSETVTVTRNEQLTALNSPDNYILALVSVDGEKAHVIYLMRAFANNPDFASVNTTFSVSSLMQRAEKIHEGYIA